MASIIVMPLRVPATEADVRYRNPMICHARRGDIADILDETTPSVTEFVYMGDDIQDFRSHPGDGRLNHGSSYYIHCLQRVSFSRRGRVFRIFESTAPSVHERNIADFWRAAFKIEKTLVFTGPQLET
jgi:hypothetical protein